MGRKFRIGILINAIYSDYSASVIDGINKFCKENDCVQIVFSILRGNNSSRYDFQYDSITSLINPQNIDVLIIASAALSNMRAFDEFLADIKNLPPMIKVSLGLKVPGMPSITVDSSKAIEELLTHVIKEHKRDKFILMHADKRCEESLERENIFKTVLKSNGIKFSEKKSLDGNFVLEHAYDNLQRYLKKNKERDFNAIFCCNDEMALGCISCLEDNGIHVPEDVSVIGFDNVLFTTAYDFGISTVDPHVETQAYEAAKMAFDLFSKKENKKIEKVLKSVPVIRTSCGCSKKSRSRAKEDMVAEKEFLKHRIHHKSSVQIYMLHYFLLESQEPVSLEKLYNRLVYCFALFDISKAILVLYEKPMYFTRDSVFIIPEKASVKMVYSIKSGIVNPDICFNPAEAMLPEEYDNFFEDTEIIFPVYAENYQYGYFFMRIGQYEKIFYQTMFELISKEIVSSIKISQSENECEKLKNKNISLKEYSEKLHSLSRTDEMTQILNRRGFYEAAQCIIDRYVSIGKTGLVIYGDMDGLKSINDTFGHEVGDKAIKAEANILKSIFRTTDIIGRLGGDEFAIVAPEMTKKDFAVIKKRIADKCKEYNQKEEDTFVLSISVGFSQFDENENCLDKLLNIADEKLYVEKREKHLRMEKIQAEKKSGVR